MSNFNQRLQELVVEVALNIKKEHPMYSEMECGRQAKELVLNTLKVMEVTMNRLIRNEETFTEKRFAVYTDGKWLSSMEDTKKNFKWSANSYNALLLDYHTAREIADQTAGVSIEHTLRR